MDWSFNWHGYRFNLGCRKIDMIFATKRQARSEGDLPGVHSFGDVTTRNIRKRNEKIRSCAGCPAEEYLYELSLTALSELKPCIQEAGRIKLGRDELILSIRRLLRPYRALQASPGLPFRIAITNAIVMEAAISCAIHLDDEETFRLWRGP